MKSISKTLSAALFVLVTIAFIFVGCSTDTSVAPPQQQTVNGLQVESNTGPVTILKMKPSSLAKGEKINLSTQGFIDAEQGGQLVVGTPIRGYSKLVFEPNALPEDMTITITYWIDEYFEGVFDPHGTQFNEPVRVELSYRNADLTGIDENDLKIYYYNESLNIWEYVGGEIDAENKLVICYLEHFSRYAIVKT